MRLLAVLLLSTFISVRAQTIVQGLSNFNGDNNNNGQLFLPSDSGITTGTADLLTFTFFKSAHGSADTAGTKFLHIATGLSIIEIGFVGSSINSIDWNSTADGAPLTFLFSSLALNPSTVYFAIFSDTSSAGSVSGAGIEFHTSNVYSNGALLDSGGASGGNAKFTATFAAIPEPSTYAALLGLGALGLVIIRRRRSTA